MSSAVSVRRVAMACGAAMALAAVSARADTVERDRANTTSAGSTAPMNETFERPTGNGCYYRADVAGSAMIIPGSNGAVAQYAPDLRVDSRVACPSRNLSQQRTQFVRGSNFDSIALSRAVDAGAAIELATPEGQCTYAPHFDLRNGSLVGDSLTSSCGPSNARGGGPSR